MKRDPRWRVGLVLSGFMTLLATLVFSLDTTITWWRGSSAVQVVFRDVQGLRKDDLVLFHGMPCGRVAQLRVQACGGLARSGVAWAAAADDGDVRVVLDLDLPAELRAHLREGCQVSIEKTLTGVTVVKLLQGQGEALPPGAVLEGIQRPDLQDITDTMHGASQQLSQVLEGVRDVVVSVRDEQLVGDALRALRDAAGAGGATMATLQEVLGENRSGIRATTEHAASLAAQLDTAAQELPAMLAHWAQLGSTAGEWVATNRPRLDAMTEDLTVTAQNLKALSSEVRHRPWRLLHAPGRAEVEALELYQSASAYGQGALDLRRAVERLSRIMEGSSAPTDPELQELLEELRTRTSRQRAFEESFWKRLERLPD